jgi:hypothetical protein
LQRIPQKNCSLSAGTKLFRRQLGADFKPASSCN